MTDYQTGMPLLHSRHKTQLLVLFIGLLAYAAGLATAADSAAQTPEDISVSSKRYIVIDADSGEIIAEHNADERVAIASLTKVFTSIEALERGELDQLITTNSGDLYDAQSSSVMGFGPNETFTLEDLLYGMMLPSGNDASHAIARALGETPGATEEEAYENFIQMMNERVANMGLVNTQFMNPHGWGVQGHYSTARDLATFMMYALQYPTFREIIGSSSYTTSDGLYTLFNNNRLLNSGYSGLIGGKTGFDNDSGWCLIEVAARGDTTLISVTLDGVAPDIWYQDNVELLNTGFTVKQQRVSDGLPVQGELLSYRDPDAALILASTQSGSSIGEPIVPANQGVAPATVNTDPNESSGAGAGDRSEILAAIGVAGLIAEVAALKAFTARLRTRHPAL